MPQSEFDIIKDYFLKQKVNRDDVRLGIGDDAAIVSIPSDKQLVIAIDTLVAGVHFPHITSAEDIGYKSLAVNLSDLAAMGAEPAWFTLALTLPESDKNWLKAFSHGLFSLAEQHNIQLVGGDTTHGPLTISIQVAGWVPGDHALRRDGAQPGDHIYVTGTVGDAALGLMCLQQPDKVASDKDAIEKLNRPIPRIETGLAIRDIATACIDVSDGLLADLGHILDKSHVGARLDRNMLPLSPSLQHLCRENEKHYSMALSGGDDYELCFCAAPEHEKQLLSIAKKTATPITCIGVIEKQSGLRLHHAEQMVSYNTNSGYDHFK